MIESSFAESRVHGFPTANVIVRTFATQRNIHYRRTKGNGTYVSLGRGERIVPLWLIRCNDNVERPVEPALGGAQPFYLDVDGAPLGLDQLPVPLTDRLEVDLATIAESKPRPQHVTMIRKGIK